MCLPQLIVHIPVFLSLQKATPCGPYYRSHMCCPYILLYIKGCVFAEKEPLFFFFSRTLPVLGDTSAGFLLFLR
ncbi:hypothetical protein XELAEV_18041623mg [Xenopus laevis]|uniref:Uncharacterized protein n=1 Tax=Xenopus laevis TaxID=8355 RepID=A0A974C2H2_XENLA|nr:hypothetical protein XELAEV_18041623mg [Xenopus laevis]